MWVPGGRAWGGQGALSVQKNEKITRTVPILKSKFNIIFISLFFLHITILFHQCNDKKHYNYISRFVVVYVIYFTHS